MDFSLNEEQLLVQQTMQKFCEKELNYEYVRWMDENLDFHPGRALEQIRQYRVCSLRPFR